MDIFLFKGRTADDQPLVVGGFCAVGHAEAVSVAYAPLEGLVFGQYKDPFVIDTRLSRFVRAHSPPEVLLLGASIHVDTCLLPGGAILGRPSVPDDSADGAVHPLWDGMHSIAFPGAFGLAVEAELPAAQELARLLCQFDGVPPLDQVCALVENYTDTYLLVYDGSGGVRGSILIRRGDACAFQMIE